MLLALVLNSFLFYILLFVVRGYVTGSTDTSLWTVYKKGVRNYCGNALSDGTDSFVVIYKLLKYISEDY